MVKPHTKNRKELVELHAHLGASVEPSVMWSIAHEQGIKLPTKNYWEFLELVVLSPERKVEVPEYLEKIYHPILDPLTSGTHSVEKAVHETFGGAYRSSNITIHELRLNPMRHNARGKHDLDHVIMAALYGMERAFLEFPQIQAGLIFCMAREFPKELNTIIAQKAIKYRHRGVVGIDFSGVSKRGFQLKEYVDVVEQCREEGLGITVHTGEAYEVDTNDMWDAVNYLSPNRIGHGILAAKDTKLMSVLAEKTIILEVCPISNLVTRAVKNINELKTIFRALIDHNVLFTINTDWPETVENAHLTDQIEFLLDNKILSEQEIDTCTVTARQATFTRPGGINAYV